MYDLASFGIARQSSVAESIRMAEVISTMENRFLETWDSRRQADQFYLCVTGTIGDRFLMLTSGR